MSSPRAVSPIFPGVTPPSFSAFFFGHSTYYKLISYLLSFHFLPLRKPAPPPLCHVYDILYISQPCSASDQFIWNNSNNGRLLLCHIDFLFISCFLRRGCDSERATCRLCEALDVTIVVLLLSVTCDVYICVRTCMSGAHKLTHAHTHVLKHALLHHTQDITYSEVHETFSAFPFV